MKQLIRWDLCRFVKTLAYFGVVPILGSAGWLQQLLGLSIPPSDQGSTAMAITRPVLVVAEEGRSDTVSALDQLLVQYGYRAHPLRPGQLSEDLTQLPDTVRQHLAGAIGITANPTEAIAMRDAIAPLLSQTSRRQVLFDFRQLTTLESLWGPVDDVVMGGVSESGIERVATGALFSGVVSTENSGGFASVRTRDLAPLDLSAYEGVRLRVRGDGNRYKVLLRDSDRWDGVGYSASFDTVPNDWITVEVPFDSLVPVFRARTLEESDGLNRSSVRAFQLMLSKFEYDGALNPTFTPGPFELLVDSIEAYGGAPPTAVWLMPSEEAMLAPARASEVMIHAASVQSSSHQDSSHQDSREQDSREQESMLLTSTAGASGILSPSLAAELCVRVLETPALRGQSMAVQTGIGHKLEDWPQIVASLR